MTVCLLFFLMIRRPPRSTLFPTRRSSDLGTALRFLGNTVTWDGLQRRVVALADALSRRGVGFNASASATQIGRAHVGTPVTLESRMPSSALKRHPSHPC